ncbi:MAG: efflux RND transporter periplasmic adaptor subunit [Vicinamibacterales bacterium]
MKTSLVTAVAPVAVMLAVAACGGGGSGDESPSAQAAAAAPASGAASGGSAANAGYFTVPQNQLSHIQVQPARTKQFETELRTTGTVDWDNDHTSQAITQVNGPITRILVDTGTRVAANQPLLYVASPDIAGAFSTYRKAENQLALKKDTLDRSKDLLQHKAIAQRDMEQAQADYNDAMTDVQTAQQALKILGVTPAEIQEADQQNTAVRPELPMRSPIAGTVVQKLVNPGQVIQAGTTIAFVISNVSTVWVQAHLYEKDLRLVHVGDTADVRSASFPDVFRGRVTYIGSMLDPATRTTPVRVVTDNPKGFLKKDQFVDVVIHDKAERDALVVPTSAVLYDAENLPFVYVQVDSTHFAQRQVTLGPQQGDVTEITNGLTTADRVVSQGSLFLQFANSYKG